MDEAHPAANAALGQASVVGNLAARGMFWLLVPAVLLTCVVMALPDLGGFFWILLAVALIVGFIAALAWMHSVSLIFSLHPHGLAIQRGWRFLPYFGQRVELFRWDEIAAVYRRIVSRYAITRPGRSTNPNDDEHQYIDHLFWYGIVTRDGRRAVLDSRFGDVMEAGDYILGEVRRRLLPDLLVRYDQGEAVTFGPLTLRQGGLTAGAHERAWSDVAGLSVRQGMLTVEFANTSAWQASLASIPNVDLFFTLLRERQPDLWVAANPAHFAEQKRIWTGPEYRR
jgi:hypothetical protein